jgi:hypothetical protein
VDRMGGTSHMHNVTVHDMPRFDPKFTFFRAMLRQLPDDFLALWLRVERADNPWPTYLRAELEWRETL